MDSEREVRPSRDSPVLRSVVRPVAGVLAAPSLCATSIRTAQTFSGIKDHTCHPINILHLILLLADLLSSAAH